jgi:N-acetylmuramic acid 6-phosphate etherase
VLTGPEFVTGSTRLKAGTATKLVLNMITTVTFIRLGHVRGTRMADMQPSNAKLVQRGIQMIRDWTGVDEPTAAELLRKAGNPRAACAMWEREGLA